MQIRSIQFKDFRSFRGEHTLSFCDPLTGEPRPITVLAGTNGTGKTTVLEAIEALTSLAVNAGHPIAGGGPPSSFVAEAWEGGRISVEVEIVREELGAVSLTQPNLTLFSAIGHTSTLPADAWLVWPNHVIDFRDGISPVIDRSDVAEALATSVSWMDPGHLPFRGGIVYFPADRRFVVDSSVTIEPPRPEKPWVDRVDDTSGWSGSLEKYWVWLNYLDLEQGQKAGTRLRPFSEKIAHLLGRDRRIYIREGRVYVTPGKRGARDVRLSELPSGEKQILLIMGELARRVRPGMVVLIDEPETSLHPALQHALIHQFREYAREENVQFILGTHSLEIVQALPTSVLFLDHLEAEPPVLEERAEMAA